MLRFPRPILVSHAARGHSLHADSCLLQCLHPLSLHRRLHLAPQEFAQPACLYLQGQLSTGGSAVRHLTFCPCGTVLRCILHSSSEDPLKGGALVAHRGDPLTNTLPSLDSPPQKNTCTPKFSSQRLLLGQLDFHELCSLERSKDLPRISTNS